MTTQRTIENIERDMLVIFGDDSETSSNATQNLPTIFHNTEVSQIQALLEADDEDYMVPSDEEFYDVGNDILKHSVDPIITTAVRTYAKEKWTYVKTVASFEDVKKAIEKQDQYIVDLRDPLDVASTGMIPSSINIPASYLNSALLMTDVDFQRVYKRKKPSKKQDLILYCRNGQLASAASNEAVKLGFHRVKTYVGGWDEWRDQMRLHIPKDIKAENEKEKENNNYTPNK